MGHRNGRLRRNRAGFLLVEALATLAISAAILAGLASVLGLLLRTADRVAVRVQDLETTGRTVAALRRDIQLMSRARWSGAARRSFVFAGEPDRIMFARSMPQESGFRATTVVVIQRVDRGDGARLLRTEAALPPGAASLQALRFGPALELYDGPAVIRFAYFARAGTAGGEVLVDSWPTDTALPSAVRIGVVDPTTGALLASQRVPLLVEAEPGCAAPTIAFCSRADPRKTSEDKPAEPPRRADPGRG